MRCCPVSVKCLVSLPLEAYDAHVLVGRRNECDRLDDLLQRARGGASGALVLAGEPGIGKSALLDYARDEATDFTLLESRGLEGEAGLAFAGLADLLRPLHAFLDAIPAPQADALAGALALRPPVAGDPFAVAAGTLSLLAAAAVERPILAIIDDAHWLDAPSAETIRFAAHRLRAATFLFAVRTGEPSSFDRGGIPDLALAGLAAADAETLVRRHADASTSVVRLLVEQAGGNPLALIEVPSMLTGGQLRGVERLPDPLPVGRDLESAFRTRLAKLDRRTRDALVVAAAGGERLDAIVGALSSLGLDEADLAPAEEAELIRATRGRLTWRHPLLRSVAYASAAPAEQRKAHRALAAVPAATSPAERAWHLASAAVGADDAAAAQLEEAAVDARLRRGHAAAGGAFERAAELTADAELRARRRLEAGRDYQLAGWTERARSLLDQAASEAVDPLLRSDVDGQRGIVEMWAGDGREARQILTAAADRVEGADPTRAATLLVTAGLAAQMAGDVAPTLAIARRAKSIGTDLDAGLELAIGNLLLNSLVLAGETDEAHELLAHVLPAALAAEANGDDLQAAATVGHCLVWLEEHDAARQIFERQLYAARAAGSLGFVPFLAACVSEVDYRVGDWDAAFEGATESVRLAEETNQLNLLAFSLATLARVQAARGAEAECRASCARALDLAARLAGSVVLYGEAALGLLDLGLGDVGAASDRLERLSTVVAGFGLREPAVVHWRSDLIEASILAGRLELAQEELGEFEREAAASGRLWAQATAARCRGMLAEDGDLRAFAEALALCERLGSPFESARTELRLGERLRRLRRPADAREPLRSALSTFEALRATPWAQRAKAELVATGDRTRRNPPPTPARLTPQEVRIALLVAEGATNRQIAAALFISPKTVGYHLAKVFEKLGLNSRAQLAALASRGGLPLPESLDELAKI